MVRYMYVVVVITQILASFVHRLSNTHWASPQMSGDETTIEHASLQAHTIARACIHVGHSSPVEVLL